MNTNRPSPRLFIAAAGFVAAVASNVASPAFSSDDEGGSSDESGALVASSVCEAQEFKALKQADPDLRIEIPKEFDTPWPTLEACRTHAAALDEETPGLVQPIPFSHKHHAGQFAIGNPREAEMFFSRRIGVGAGGTQLPIEGGGRRRQW